MSVIEPAAPDILLKPNFNWTEEFTVRASVLWKEGKSATQIAIELGGGLTTSEGAPAETQASILTRIDGCQNHSFVLRARTTIGRNPDNDLSLAMGSVSRHRLKLDRAEVIRQMDSEGCDEQDEGHWHAGQGNKRSDENGQSAKKFHNYCRPR